jgi:cellulose synthase subunit
LDLRQLPSPLVDNHSYRPKLLSVLLPPRVSSQTLEGTALLIANYAARLGDELAVHVVNSIDAASGPLLIVGTPEEQPMWRLGGQLPFRLFRTGREMRLGSRQGPFDAGEGIVALTEKPGRTFTPILLVTGNSPQAVSRAVRKLIEGSFNEPGTFARISQDVPITSRPRREWRGFVPPDSHFTLSQLGFKELKFDALNDFSLSVPIRATPDAAFLEYGHQMKLGIRFNSDAGIEHATLDVDWNGANLGRFAATDFSAGSRMSIPLKIPSRLLRQQNVLSMKWHGLDGSAEKDPSAWLLSTTEFDLPRDYRSSLPDLALLRPGLFPFGLRSDLSDAIIVLPEESSGEVAAALFEFAGLLGRLVPGDRFGFGVRRTNELTRETRASSHLITFRIGELSKGSRSKRALASIEEKSSPWNAEKYLLNVTSSSPAALHAAIGTIFSETVLERLSGDTAYIYADGTSSFKTAPVRQISEYSYSTHLQAWLKENWIALPLILTAISCLLFVALRLMLVQYKNRNLPHGAQACGLTSSNGPRNPL